MTVSDQFAGKVAIVTGAGRGMGRAVADLLATRGARVVVNDINAEAVDECAATIVSRGCAALAVPGDITSKADIGLMVGKTIERFATADILINAAGVVAPTRFDDITETEWEHVVNVNLKGTFLCCQAVVPVMRKAKSGRIVNFSSTAGKNVSTIGGAHYTASKAGVLGLTRHLATEVADHGVTVNAICPGLIDTEMVSEFVNEDQRRAYEASFPIPRLGTAHEVAELVAFLCSNEAGYITGASFDINGGDLMV